MLERGWEFEVWTEPPEAEVANLRFLAGYRRCGQPGADLAEELREIIRPGITLGEAFAALPGHPLPLVRAAALHLLWTQHVTTDLGVPLSAGQRLRAGPAVVAGSGRPDPPPAVADPAGAPPGEEGQPRDCGRSPEGDGSGRYRMSGAATRVGVGTRFHLDGEIVTVEEVFVAAAGVEILVKDGRGLRSRVSLRAILASGRGRVIADKPGPSAGDPGETASVVLAQLDEAERSEILQLAAHLNELTCGYRSGSAEMAADGEPRPCYAPDVPLMSRYRAKAAELGVGERTIRRWVQVFEVEGESGLVRVRHVGAADAGGLGRADGRWVEMALEILDEHKDQSTPSRAWVISQIGPRLAARLGEGAVPLPSRTTAYEWMTELERRTPTFRLSAKRNRDIAGRPGGVYGKLRPTRPGEYILIDTTRLDVFGLDPLTMRWVQAELTVSMDWYSRCITGMRVTPVSTKSVDASATLYQAYRPVQAGKDWPAHAVWPDHGVPRGILLDPAAVEGPMATAAAPAPGPAGVMGPAVVPETVIVDHGKIYLSEHLTSVCRRMGVSVQPARLRTGRDKGPVERFFRTLREGLLQSLPGYKGPDLYARGLEPEREAFFFLNELGDIVREWTAVVYHHRPHRGLVDPRVPGLELSPAAMYDHGVARAGYIEVPRDPDLAFEFLKTVWCPIHHYGVETRGCRYNGPGIDDFRGQTSPYTSARAKGRWPVQVDPDDITRVYFRHPGTGRWHTLTWEHAPALDMPLSEEALQFGRKMAARKYRYPDDQTAVAELLERWNLGLGLTRTERRMALRLAREQQAFDLPGTGDADQAAQLPSVRRVLDLASEDASEEQDADEPQQYAGAEDGDDDLEEELDTGQVTDDFYADALDDA